MSRYGGGILAIASGYAAFLLLPPVTSIIWNTFVAAAVFYLWIWPSLQRHSPPGYSARAAFKDLGIAAAVFFAALVSAVALILLLAA